MQRIALALSLIAALALSGCVSIGENKSDTNKDMGKLAPVEAKPAPAPLPKPIKDSKMVPAGTDVFNQAMMDACSQPVSGCYKYPFKLDRTATVHAKLAWTIPANDFDLYIFHGSVQGEASGGSAPGTSEELDAELDAGDYSVVVVAWLAAADTYTIDATFGEPAPA